MDDGFTTGAWHGLPNHLCADCAYATLDLAEMRRHRAEAHAPWPPAPRASGLVLGPDGRPITEPEEEEI